MVKLRGHIQPKRYSASPWGDRRRDSGLSVREVEARSRVVGEELGIAFISRFYVTMIERNRVIPTPEQADLLLAVYRRAAEEAIG